MEIENKKKCLYTPAMKRAIDNYRIKNKEKFREYANKKALEYYNNNKEIYKEEFKKYYRKKQEATGIIPNKVGRPKKIKNEELII
jgi:hypothetical protein